MRKKRSFKVNRCYHLISRIAHCAYFFDEEEDAAAEKTRAVEAQIPDALPVQLERGDNRVAMSVLVALKDGAKKPAQLRDAVQLRNRQFFTSTYLKPMTDAGLIEMTIPERPNSSQQAYRLTEKGYAAVA